MPSWFPLLTLIIVGAIGVSFWMTYREKALRHPGFLFCGLWVLVILSYMIINSFPNAYNICNPQIVFELYSLVLINAVSFFLFKNREKLSTFWLLLSLLNMIPSMLGGWWAKCFHHRVPSVFPGCLILIEKSL